MFLGNSTHNLDSKGRVFIPKRIQGKLALDEQGIRRVLLCPGMGDCVALYTEAGYAAWMAQLSTSSFETEEALQLQRYLFPNTFEIDLDSASRLLIPEPLRKLGRLTDEVVLAGLVDRVELWDKATFEAQGSGAPERYRQQGARWAKGYLSIAAAAREQQPGGSA